MQDGAPVKILFFSSSMSRSPHLSLSSTDRLSVPKRYSGPVSSGALPHPSAGVGGLGPNRTDPTHLAALSLPNHAT